MSSRYIRGSSILAALLLVGALAVVSFGVQAISGNQDPRSMSAEAAVPITTLTVKKVAATRVPSSGTLIPRTKPILKNDAPKSCVEAINKARDKGWVSDPAATGESTGLSGIVDNCFGAVLKDGYQGDIKKAKDSDYQCVGRQGKAVVLRSGVKVTTSPDPSNVLKDKTKGQCKITVCWTVKGVLKCNDAELYDGGVNLDRPFAPIDPMASAREGEVKKYNLWTHMTSANGDAPDFVGSEADSKAINDAFDVNAFRSGNSEIDNKVAKGELDSAQAKLNELKSLQGYCVDANSGPGCTSVAIDSAKKDIQAAQADVDKATQDLENLKKLQQSEMVQTKCASAACADGEIAARAAAAKVPVPQPRPETPPFVSGPGQKDTGSGGGLGDIMKSILGGLAKALGGGAGSGTGAPCPSDPAAYSQAQQQYQQQMQQYNTQLQQYNYQQQLNQLNGLPQPVPPVAPQPCQQTSDSNTCPAAPAQPSCPAGTTATAKKTQSSSGAQCTTGWQCVAGAQPTAQISCQPQLADVGMNIAISFTCGNSTGSEGQGFDSANLTSGSSTPVITAPPDNARTANFGINCKKDTLAAAKQCSIQINRPSIVLLANPQAVALNASSTIGWVTTGMSTCVISSPTLADFTAENAANTSVNGGVVTPNLSTTTTMLLHCVTLAGGTRDATTTVEILPGN